MGYRLGLDAKIYFKTGGVAGSGTWTEMSNVRDVTLNMEKAEADVTTRAADGWRNTVGTLKEASVEFEMIWDPEDAGFAAVFAAFLNNTILGIAVLDGDGALSTSTAEGLIMDCNVMNCSRTEPLEEALKASVSLKAAYSATAPAWTTTGLP